MSILHIMPHMGPGPGKAVSSLIIYSHINKFHEHKVLLLERPTNMTYIQECINNAINVIYTDEEDEIEKLIIKADIVQLEWWHHPKMFKILMKLSRVKVRVVVWSHISGCSYPYLSAEFIQSVHKFIFTTKFSYENLLWSETEKTIIKGSTRCIPGSGSYKSQIDIQEQTNSDFCIGYMGTIDFVKLNPEYVEFCAALDIPDYKVIMIGDDKNAHELKSKIKGENLQDKFIFKGFVSDIKTEMKDISIFCYLLNKDHYGSTDNVLLEAMSFGKAIIILNQCGEKYVIENNKTGIIVNNIQEFVDAVKNLYSNPEKRYLYGKNANQEFNDNYSVEVISPKMNAIYNELLFQDKRMITFNEIFGNNPFDWFYKGLGKYAKLFDVENGLLDAKNVPKTILAETKSSIFQFQNCYRDDEKLKYFSDLARNHLEKNL